MSIEKIQELVNGMEPEKAASAIAEVMQKLLPFLEEDARLRFVLTLFGEPSEEKLGSLVHL
jgi:hypothetical protein